MHAATRRRKDALTAAPLSDMATHRAWLQALSLPAALVSVRNDARAVEASNAAFDRLYLDLRATGGLLDKPELAAAIARVLTSGDGEKRVRCSGGSSVEGRDFLADISLIDVRVVAVVLQEVTAAARANRLLQRQMFDDPLTGLPNRAGFVDLLDGRMDALGAKACAVLAINLAHFSRVNDCMGTLGGDELLVTVARRLKSGLRDGDVIGRTGPDEFAIIVEQDTTEEDVLKIARRVERALAMPFRLSDFEIRVDCAIGGARAEECEDAEQAMRHAQLALKLAKATRRVEFYRPSALTLARRRFSLETELRRAIENDALSLAFQPLVALSTGRVIGFEALARWSHPEFGNVGPAEFISVAEESGLIVPLGRWVLDKALATLAEWDRHAGHVLPVYVAVNVSPIEVARDDVAGRVAEALARHGLNGERLTIELTESVLVAEPEHAATMLAALKQTRAQVAMDDFGTGYSNLAVLRRLPIDVLKVDRSLVGEMMDNADKTAIVSAILSLADALGLRVTAEGVETGELAHLLDSMGCATGQGYYFAKPLAPEQALDFVLASHTGA